METNISQLILEDRERRYNEILKLLSEYDLPVLCGKLNYPGVDKNTVEANKAFAALCNIIKDSFIHKTILSRELTGYDGRSILAVIEMEPEEIKKITTRIEEGSQLGRIFDMDVYIGDGSSIGREMISMPPRKCLLCEENAKLCVRSGKHNLKEILNKINEIINNYGE